MQNVFIKAALRLYIPGFLLNSALGLTLSFPTRLFSRKLLSHILVFLTIQCLSTLMIAARRFHKTCMERPAI
jgi:hypothetical protein